MALKELHLVVSHPVLGQFVAKKITDPEKLKDDTYIDRTVNNLERYFKNKAKFGEGEPAILCRRIEE